MLQETSQFADSIEQMMRQTLGVSQNEQVEFDEDEEDDAEEPATASQESASADDEEEDQQHDEL